MPLINYVAYLLAYALNSKKYIKEQLENYLKEIIIKKYFKNNEKITIKYEHDIHFTDISNNKEINEQE